MPPTLPSGEKARVLFVCLGNICRSPTAEGIFRAKVDAAGLTDNFTIDSAGTGNWHIGSPPDARSIEAAAARGIDLRALRARQVTPDDLLTFDYVLAMDADNLRVLTQIATPDGTIPRLMLDYAAHTSMRDVPDPYYDSNFDAVFDMLDDAAEGLLRTILEKDKSSSQPQ